jgi:hypothetical protein
MSLSRNLQRSNTVGSKRVPNKTTTIPRKNDGTDIRDISFRPISDKFSWGNYGGFKVILNEDGYINATNMSQTINGKTGGNKQFRGWKRNASSQEFIDEVSSSTGYSEDKLFVVISGGKKEVLRGTYVHPLLVPHIAAWVSPKFGVKISTIVNEYFIKEEQTKQRRLLNEKDDKIDELNSNVKKLLENNNKLLDKNDNMDKRIKRLFKKNDDIYDQNNEIKDKIDTIANDRVVSSLRNGDTHQYIIINNNVDPDEYGEDEIPYDYYVMRLMKKNVKTRLNDHKHRYPYAEVVLIISYTPNSMNLNHRIRAGLNDKRIFSGNYFYRADGYSERRMRYSERRMRYSERRMKRDILKIHNKRFDVGDV